jgi:hypothetical protein
VAEGDGLVVGLVSLQAVVKHPEVAVGEVAAGGGVGVVAVAAPVVVGAGCG